MGMMIKKNESAVETAKREQAIKAAQTIKEYCKSAKECKGCLFNTKGHLCMITARYPELWDVSTLAPTRAEMEKYVKDHCFLRTFKNGRTTATVYNGKLYLVTRYYKDKDDELVATYELYKKIFG